MSNNFSQFGITAETKYFSGPKIKASKLLGKQITVNKFRIRDSKFKDNGNGKRLDLDITFNDTSHPVWTSSTTLMEMIEKVPTDKYPFKTTIIEENERYIFT